MSRRTDRTYTYRPAWWLPNAHLQTLWGKFVRRYPPGRMGPEPLPLPDGDSIELHHLRARDDAPHLLMLHGLEGSPRSHYIGGMLLQAMLRGWGATLMVFRGCGSVPNTARRFYHSGETRDIGFVFEHLRQRWRGSPWLIAGVSLGANVLLKWLGECGATIDRRLIAAAAVS